MLSYIEHSENLLMKMRRTAIPDVVVFETDAYGDDRGFFLECYRSSWFDDLNISPVFVQDNHTRSKKDVLRGLHMQSKNTQGKLIRVTHGEIYDVAVDMRLGSPTYGQWVGEYLSEGNHNVFWIPEGFAHGFLVMSETAEVTYKCTEFYDPESEMIIAWDDTFLGIDWPIDKPLLSEKDRNGVRLQWIS